MKRHHWTATTFALATIAAAFGAQAQDRVGRAATPATSRRVPEIRPPAALPAPVPASADASTAAEDAPPTVAPAANTAPSDDAVDRSLIGYGRWIDDPRHGRIWVPSPECVGKDFAPYVTGGHWALDGDSWRWKSAYPWGDATFHYGNWIWRKELGWAWVPGTTYAPAWVVWRLGAPGKDFVGWAPMPPTGERTDSLPFHFVPTQHLFSRELSHHLVTDPALGRQLLGRSNLLTLPSLSAGRPDDVPPLVPVFPTLRDARIRALNIVDTTSSALPHPAPSPATVQEPPRAATASALGGTYRCRVVTQHPQTWRCGNE